MCSKAFRRFYFFMYLSDSNKKDSCNVCYKSLVESVMYELIIC